MKITRILLTAAAFVVFANFTFAQTTPDTVKNSSHKMKHNEQILKGTESSNNIVRKGRINVEIIDKNKDGKVFQDMMDWNVISDAPGKCPLCGMTLREVTIKEAERNLKKHGFKVIKLKNSKIN